MVIGGLPIVAFAILNNGPAVVGVLKITFTVQVIYWHSSTSPFLEVLLVIVCSFAVQIEVCISFWS
jgi:hypothetical protein